MRTCVRSFAMFTCMRTFTPRIPPSQLHVLGYTLHSVLQGISSAPKDAPPTHLLTTGNLDPSLDLISPVLVDDLFGTPAEERESGENIAKIPESKSPQSYNCYEIVAQYISPNLLPEFLAPVKQVSF